MKNTIQNIATYAVCTGARGLFLILFLGLAGCAGTSLQPVRPVVFDLGPGPLAAPAPAPVVKRTALVLGEVEAPVALESTAVQYRLAYLDALQLKPYSKARWSMAPAQLLRQRLREHLSMERALLNPGEGGLSGAEAPHTLRVDLEEFSQLFEAPDKSVGLLRLRVTLVMADPSGGKKVAQRSMVVQRPAPTADAAGGVRALTAAVDAAVQEIGQWVRDLAP